MNHDVIDERYARLFELPNLMGQDLDVSAFCLDYRLGKPALISEDLKSNWSRTSIPRTFLVGWFFALLAFAKRARPQAVVASSDCLHVVLGAFVARLFGATFFADLYDDYSTFGLAKIPGMRWLYFRALARADGICAVSHTLGRDLEQEYPGKPVLVLESTIDADQFAPRDKAQSREVLGLEDLADKKLVGVCGGLNAFHGADIVFGAFPEVFRSSEDVVFLVAGKLYDECPLPELDNVRYLGMLPHNQMAYFFSAMDVAVIALSNTRFGYYAFPQKAYEVLACKVPVAAADVGALSILFQSLPAALYDPDSSASLADTVNRQLEDAAVLQVEIPSWRDQALKLGNFIRQHTL